MTKKGGGVRRGDVGENRGKEGREGKGLGKRVY